MSSLVGSDEAYSSLTDQKLLESFHGASAKMHLQNLVLILHQSDWKRTRVSRNRDHGRLTGIWGAVPPNINGRHRLASTSDELKMKGYYGIAIVQIGNHSLVTRVKNIKKVKLGK